VLAGFGLTTLATAWRVPADSPPPSPYAAPELSRGLATAAADVYALCATLSVLLLAPHQRHDLSGNLDAVLELSWGPIELTDLLRRGMHDDPTQRPTASALHDALIRSPCDRLSTPILTIRPAVRDDLR